YIPVGGQQRRQQRDEGQSRHRRGSGYLRHGQGTLCRGIRWHELLGVEFWQRHSVDVKGVSHTVSCCPGPVAPAKLFQAGRRVASPDLFPMKLTTSPKDISGARVFSERTS